MIKNLYVIGDIEKLLKIELNHINKNVEKDIREQKRKLVLQKNTPWGQLTNPKTKIGRYYDKYGELLTMGGFAVDAFAGVVLIFGFMMFITSAYINNADLMKISENWLKNVIQYAKYPFFCSLPFLGMSAIKNVVKNNFDEREKEIVRLENQVEKRKQTLQGTVSTIQNAYNQQTEMNFFKDFLENVDLNGNTILYNKELIILLSEVSNHPTKNNLRRLSDFLHGSISNEISTSSHTASSEFLNCEKVKQIKRSY